MAEHHDTPVVPDRQSGASTNHLPFNVTAPGFTPEIRVYATSPEDLVFMMREWAKDLGHRLADGRPPFDESVPETFTFRRDGREVGTVVWRTVPGCDIPDWLAEDYTAEQ